MATSQQELLIGRLRSFAEANGWLLIGMDLRGVDIQLTFSHAKPEAAPAAGTPPQTVVPPAGR